MIDDKAKSQLACYQALQDAGLPVVSISDNRPRYSRLLTAPEQSAADTVLDAYNAGQFDYLDKREYPSPDEQLDMQYWDAMNGTTVWRDTITAIKAANPKP